MRFIIYGAGGIGGTIGARLFQQDQSVVLIARGEHGAQLQRQGLRFIHPQGDEQLPIPTVLHPRDITFEVDDVVLLCVKSQQTQEALSDLRAAAGAEVALVCAQNGVANEALALRQFDRVYAMLVILPALHLQPGEVITNAANAGGVLDLGRYPGRVDGTAKALAQHLEDAGFSAQPDAQVMRKKYAKLLSNLNNGLSALTNFADGSKDIARRLRAEALACYAAANIECADATLMASRSGGVQVVSMPEFPRMGGSTWQSVLRGTGNVEVDYLNGEIVLLGRRTGVPTPANRAVQAMTWELARRGGEAGSVAVADILERIAQYE